VTTLTDAADACTPDAPAPPGAASMSGGRVRLRAPPRLRAGEAVRLLDVREPDEAALQRIPGASCSRFLASCRSGPAPGGGDAAILVYCAQGPRSQRAARVLRGAVRGGLPRRRHPCLCGSRRRGGGGRGRGAPS
jgi:adenylyltransferase/sulfurtransferase